MFTYTGVTLNDESIEDTSPNDYGQSGRYQDA